MFDRFVTLRAGIVAVLIAVLAAVGTLALVRSVLEAPGNQDILILVSSTGAVLAFAGTLYLAKSEIKISGLLAATITVIATLGTFALVRSVFLAFNNQEAATWVGSVGTILAFGGTIYLAGSETRRRHEEEKAIAAVRAASMLMRIGSLRRALIAIGEWIATAPCQYSDYQALANRLRDVPMWVAEDSIAIIPVNKDAAVRLAHIAASVEVLLRQLDRYSDLNNFPGLNIQQLNEGFSQTVYSLINGLVLPYRQCCILIGMPDEEEPPG